MSRIAPSLFTVALLLLGLHDGPALAQSARTFVSAAIGNDANDCFSPATPCRSFQVAHDKTADQGELVVLDSGGYGALTITKSISIASEGREASILVSGGNTGITINAPAATGYVNLRGLTVQGVSGGASTGLRFNSGVALTIANCVIRNHTGNGIEFFPTDGVFANLVVLDTLVSDNGGSGISVSIGNIGASAKVILNRVAVVNNSKDGINLFAESNFNAAIQASATDTLVGNNGGKGFNVFSGGNILTVVVSRSVVANNDIGLAALEDPGPLRPRLMRFRIGQSTVTGNRVTFTGSVQSFGDNDIEGNLDDDRAPATIPKK